MMDPLAAADFRLDQLRDSSSCANCGSLEPTRLGDGGCSDCRTYPSCFICGRWVGPGMMPSVLVVFSDISDVTPREVCDLCMERAEE